MVLPAPSLYHKIQQANVFTNQTLVFRFSTCCQIHLKTIPQLPTITVTRHYIIDMSTVKWAGSITGYLTTANGK